MIGCLTGASFFVACNQEPTTANEDLPEAQDAKAEEETKELDMHEASELALLMRNMYDENLALRKRIMEGDIPKSFPADFKKIHTAEASEELNSTFDALAEQYLKDLEAITSAKNTEEGIKAYNGMVSTCASCHTIYCQGPLAKIKRMRISAPGQES